ncbi:hypothetical protein [Salisediminibacterium beveridgei]|uniref:hypothetical protein n=1 Tax=Salisediminibacterium beveridgei TaxID=632773 RepID=UPI0012EEB37C|nr:hypothetical protein [Salisediminibacterium beveridgei]
MRMLERIAPPELIYDPNDSTLLQGAYHQRRDHILARLQEAAENHAKGALTS